MAGYLVQKHPAPGRPVY